MKFTDTYGKVCDTEDLKHATIQLIDRVAIVLYEMKTYADRDHATTLPPHVFQRWLDVLKKEP